MTKPRLSTGDVLFDEFLQGGYEIDVISTIFGPSGSGKTNLCLISLVATIKAGKKVIFIDTEGGFSLSRLEQIAPDFRTFLDNILILKPTNFQEQKRAFEKLQQVVDDRVGLIIVDGVSMLYRLELGKTDDVYHVNRELGQQIGMLTEIARKKDIPILLTNQVYSSFDEQDKVNMVGGDILKYGSKCLLELEKLHSSKRRILIKKHRSLPEGRALVFDIVQEGMRTGETYEKPVQSSAPPPHE
ncbi:TPA: DNA repair and recombination protein RadB [Candidatus Woesearchaeota archaeon]|nr:DNA repair and recombination protein RadB [Candidatus Woesearchaeota archaeon]HIH47005.1 DNA repair and recombination protein RadB [Candidatus Woesearchaeota archaeon]